MAISESFFSILIKNCSINPNKHGIENLLCATGGGGILAPPRGFQAILDPGGNRVNAAIFNLNGKNDSEMAISDYFS